MNLKTWTPLALAIVLGLIAAKVARDALARRADSGQGQGHTVKVVVVKGPVAPGQELTVDALGLAPIAAEAPPAGAFTDPGAVVGRVSATPMFAGQPVMDSLLAPRGAGAGLQALVPRGMRALTVEVNETSGLAGMITPGCHVDVVCTLNGGSKDETVACTIVQDVLVQAVGQRLSAARNADEKEPPPVRSVTLIATPRDAEAIELASSTGRTRLVLRGANDRTMTDSTGVRFVELRREDSILPPIPTGTAPSTQPTTVATSQPASDPFADVPRQRRTVTLIRGGTRSEVVFDVPSRGTDSKSDDAVTRTDDMPAEE